MRSILVTLFVLGISACGGGGLHSSAMLHELDAESYREQANRYGVSPDLEAFALHRNGRCEDVYVRGFVTRTTDQQHKMVRIAACNGERIARE